MNEFFSILFVSIYFIDFIKSHFVFKDYVQIINLKVYED